MKGHLSTIVPRMIRAALRVKQCRYRVVAIGIDSRNRIISIATNAPAFTSTRLARRGEGYPHVSAFVAPDHAPTRGI